MNKFAPHQSAHSSQQANPTTYVDSRLEQCARIERSRQLRKTLGYSQHIPLISGKRNTVMADYRRALAHSLEVQGANALLAGSMW